MASASAKDEDQQQMILLSDPARGSIAKASSVLQKNIKLYGPMNALDISNKLTSWNSDGTSDVGKQQAWYSIDFSPRRVIPTNIKIQFQAGFTASEVTIQGQTLQDDGKWEDLMDDDDDILEMEDVHGIQSFDLYEEEDDFSSNDNKPLAKKHVKAIKLIFDECTDFYGRVIIYQLQVWGHEETIVDNNDNNNETSSSSTTTTDIEK